MMIVKAKLIRLNSRDGLFEMWEDVPLGKVYEIDLDTIQIAEGYNTVHNVWWKKEIVFTSGSIEWFPTELLKFDRTQGN